MSTVAQSMSLALHHHQAGRLEEAERIYRDILLVEPSHYGALHFLGVIAYQRGNHCVAVESIQRALAIEPGDAAGHSNLGLAYAGLGKLEEAARCYERAIKLNPSNPEANYNLGSVLRKQGQLDEAVAHYRAALKLLPAYPEASSDLGVALTDQGKLHDAVACLRRALTLKPDFAEAHHNLAVVLQKQHKLDEAVASFRRALEIKPTLVAALNGLGAALQEQEKSDEAIASFQSALALAPDYADAHNNLGNALKDQARLTEALACYRRAAQLNPGSTCAQNNFLYLLSFCPGFDAAAIYEEHRRWNQQQAAPFAQDIQPHANDRTPGRRLRIGYVSPDFRNHVQSFFTLPLLASHDRQGCEVVCYADVASPDSVTAQLRAHAHTWRSIAGLSDDQLAETFRHDRIDILVDLAMHMAQGRPLIFARRPAPVQVCWLAYPGTTGLSAIGYRLTDPYLDPPGLDDRYYSEESIRLPDSFWCYEPLAGAPEVQPLPAAKAGHTTFGSLNNFCKVNDEVLKLWARVLRAVERSHLVLMAPRSSPRERTLALLEAEGIAAERIEFVGRQSLQQYLETYHRIDIGLDTFPYNGHTTSLDAYFMGVPVITLPGQTVVGRAGVSQLTNLGLTELIAHSPDRFVQIAASLASDTAALSELRSGLRERMRRSPLMDAPRFARNIEAAYRRMWERWCVSAEKR